MSRHDVDELVRVLMDRDGMDRDEARTAVLEARQRVHDGEDPEEILYEEFGLEPDYTYCLL
jgi:hypothetical protein